MFRANYQPYGIKYPEKRIYNSNKNLEKSITDEEIQQLQEVSRPANLKSNRVSRNQTKVRTKRVISPSRIKIYNAQELEKWLGKAREGPLNSTLVEVLV